MSETSVNNFNAPAPLVALPLAEELSVPSSSPHASVVDDLSMGQPRFLRSIESFSGRFSFPPSDPSTTNNWTVGKWKEQLSLSPFKPTDEISLEAWVEENTRAVAAYAPSLGTFLSVLALVADPANAEHISALRVDTALRTLEDVTDRICASLFCLSRATTSVELSFFALPRSPSVMDAKCDLLKLVRTYTYMCRRHERPNFLTNPFLSDALLRSVPIVVEHRVHDYHSGLVDFVDTLKRCQEAESALRVRHGGSLPAPPAPLSFATKRAPSTACFGCGGDHWRVACPHREDRCPRCGKLGHVKSHCRMTFLKDSAGNTRVALTPRPSRVEAEFRLDRTRAQHLQATGNVVSALQKAEATKSATASARNAKRASEAGRTPRPKRPHSHDFEAGPPAPITLFIEEETDPLSNDDADPVCYTSSVPDELHLGRSLPQVDVVVNGKLHRVVLDSGTEVDIMSAHTAGSLHLLLDHSSPPVVVHGIGGAAPPMPLTNTTSLQMPHGPAIGVRFRVSNDRTPTLLSYQTLKRLNVHLDHVHDLLLTPSGTYSLCFATNTVSQTLEDASEIGHIEKTVKAITEPLDISPPLKEQFSCLLLRYSDTWANPKAGKCTTVTVDFKVSGKPKRFNPRPLSKPLLDEAHTQVKDLLKAGVIIEDPQSAWASPIVMVPKKAIDGVVRWRMAIDYRYVNRLLEDDNYPLPTILDLYSQLYGRKYFTCIDLNWGFWNVRLTEECQKYTAFVVPQMGIYLWKVLPFGMKTSPTEFQHAIEAALRPLIIEGFVKVYIDDILIATLTQSHHLQILERVLEQLRQCGLFINMKKCQFLRTSVLYLGSVISHNCIKPDPKKIQGLQAATPPTDVAQLRSFLGAAGYLRHFVPSFSDTAQPLNQLLKKNTPFLWDEAQQEAFDQIRHSVAVSTFLSLPDPARGFVIYTDASNVGVGAVLCQKTPNGGLDYIYFASRSLNETERRWGVGEREAFAIVWACETFERYIRGIPTVVYTDHKNLNWMGSSLKGKVLRWTIRLQEFTLSIRYIAGSDNCIADWLSRSAPADEILEDRMLAPLSFHVVEVSAPPLPTLVEIAEAARAESGPHVRDIVWQGDVPHWHRTGRLYVPEKHRSLVLWWFHASSLAGHMGVNRMVRRLQRHFSWPRLAEDARLYVQQCILCSCLRRGPQKRKGVPGALTSGRRLWDIVSLDFIGPLNFKDGHQHFLHVMIDHFSRFVVVGVESDSYPTCASVQAFFESRWLSYFGCPRSILTDRGSQYVGKGFSEYVVQELGIPLIHTSPYYPQGNGVNESSHRLLLHALRSRPTTSSNLVAFVRQAVMVYNATPHPALFNHTPYSAVYGKDMVLPALGAFTPDTSEAARGASQKDLEVRSLFKHLLSQLTFDAETPPISPPFVGDIVCYPFNKDERPNHPHSSGVPKWAASWSFPHRVISIHDRQARLRPLWLTDNFRDVPLAQIRRLPSRIPRALRDIIPAVIPADFPLVQQEEDVDPLSILPTEHPPAADPTYSPPSKRRKVTFQPSDEVLQDTRGGVDVLK